MENFSRATTSKLSVVQNLGWFDRSLRFVLGIGMVVLGIYMLFTVEGPLWLTSSGTVPAVAYYLPILAVYPLLTAILGWDPLYSRLQYRSCDTSSRNRCGTFPFEVDAALGHNPVPRDDVSHSLGGSRHDPGMPHAVAR